MPFGSIWLAVVVSAVAVWIASSIVHMLLGYHKADYSGFSNEDEVRAAIRKGGPAPGYYSVPHVEEMKSLGQPEVKAKFVEGPRALIALVPNGPPTMGKELAMWFGLNLLVSFLVGYVARHSLTPATDGRTVLRIAASVAFIAYGIGPLVDKIWRGLPTGNVVRALIDAVIYALVTGAVFFWLWPYA